MMQLFMKKIDVQEEDIFSELHHFLLRKNNRYLTNDEVVTLTGISTELLHKWVKSGKLKSALFPNLGAPCERCGTLTKSKICLHCSSSIVGTLQQEEKDRLWFSQIQHNHARASAYHHK
ncbi:hypothetical protein [Lysinibacillus piscis]|uniref:Flagellar protein n=1 Tax=Lysinibacillus piscis TaxID=2518931 RepID=A0ABQ5NMS0_9BACI|nr:hypothetical protein [Lysinibacillus sp. KH24]GLC89540.1 hypothetical protein LYSBPC_26670 [Lysinibacillus sp. KH24]